jgi:hypothetical protein
MLLSTRILLEPEEIPRKPFASMVDAVADRKQIGRFDVEVL